MSSLMRAFLLSASLLLAGPVVAEPLQGPAAFGDWRADAPGVSRLIRPTDLPALGASRASASSARVVRPPEGASLRAPPGFTVAPYATGLGGARTIRVAPNGDVFVAQTSRGVVTVLRPGPDGTVGEIKTFATGLEAPFGLAFYPPGPDPQWLYVASTSMVQRIPYKSGDLVARGKPETIVTDLPDGGHSTRDLVFSRDGGRMLVSVGSASNVAEDIGPAPKNLAAFEASHAIGATWGDEEWRAAILSFKPDGSDRKIFATGLRNCVSITLAPRSDRLWCAVNERDMLGDDLPPDYATEVRPGGFYGWPWFYLGPNVDRRVAPRPDLADKVIAPDVLIQAHSAPLGIAFYDGAAFPPDYRGDAFVALHGSWNRAKRTGYKIVRLRFEEGRPTGAYEDFVTGFVFNDSSVWGRPVSVAVAADGALLFSEDGNGTLWRVSWSGAKGP